MAGPARADHERLADPGSQGRGLRAPLRRTPRGEPRGGDDLVHDGASSGAAGGRYRPRRRGDRAGLHLGRVRQRRALLRGHPGLCRCRPAHVQHQHRARTGRSDGADARGDAGASLRPLRGHGATARRIAGGRGPGRGRRLRRRRSVGRALRWRARGRRGLLLSPAQVGDHGRRRHGHHERRRDCQTRSSGSATMGRRYRRSSGTPARSPISWPTSTCSASTTG